MNLHLPKSPSTPLYLLCITIYFLWLSGGGLDTGFSHDDLMNMYRAWAEPLPKLVATNFCFFLFPSSYRPLGGLFYHVFFNGFGLNPLPFRLLLLFFLLANIYLTYAFVHRITASREAAAIAALLHCYHIYFMPLYRNTGTCYDIFCFFFYIAAFLYYIRIRQAGRFLRPVEQLGFLSLLVCALNAKEAAVTLPVLIGVYELLYHPPTTDRPRALVMWLWRNGRLIIWGIFIDLAFIFGKIYGANGIGRQGGYATTVGPTSLIHSLQHDLNEVFFTYGTSVLRDRNLVLLLLVALLIAWCSKSASLKFALLLWLIGVLPTAFIRPRGIYAIYIPLVGLAMFAAILFAKVRIRGTPPAVAFLILALTLAWFFRSKGAGNMTETDTQSAQITSVINQMRVLLPAEGSCSRMLFLKDPFDNAPNEEWATVFVTQLLCRDKNVEVDRLERMPHEPDAAGMLRYDRIFTIEQGRIVLANSTDRRVRLPTPIDFRRAYN